MNKKQTSKFVSRLATCSVVVGGLAIGAPADANAEEAFSYSSLGTGAEMRAQVLPGAGVLPVELKGEEGKCGEGKCGEGKCGDGDGEGEEE